MEPPRFVAEWEAVVDSFPLEVTTITPAESLTNIWHSYAILRANVKHETINPVAAIEEVGQIDARLEKWSADALSSHYTWRFTSRTVPDSPDVWNGIRHTYANNFAWGVWMSFRSIRILLSRTERFLCSLLHHGVCEWDETTSRLDRICRQMTDDICAAIPSMLGETSRSHNPSPALIDTYSIIWPLFLAGICSQDRLKDQARHTSPVELEVSRQACAVTAQLTWILGRLEYANVCFGVNLAGDLATSLRDQYGLRDEG